MDTFTRVGPRDEDLIVLGTDVCVAMNSAGGDNGVRVGPGDNGRRRSVIDRRTSDPVGTVPDNAQFIFNVINVV